MNGHFFISLVLATVTHSQCSLSARLCAVCSASAGVWTGGGLDHDAMSERASMVALHVWLECVQQPSLLLSRSDGALESMGISNPDMTTRVSGAEAYQLCGRQIEPVLVTLRWRLVQRAAEFGCGHTPHTSVCPLPVRHQLTADGWCR